MLENKCTPTAPEECGISQKPERLGSEAWNKRENEKREERGKDKGVGEERGDEEREAGRVREGMMCSIIQTLPG